MASELIFTLGAIHFGVKGAPGTKIAGKDYIEAIRGALATSTNVERVRLSVDSGFEKSKFVVPEPPQPRSSMNPDLGAAQVELDDLVPAPEGLQIDVELHIPRRVQAEVLGPDLQRWIDPDTEHFRAHWRYSWSVPLVTVIPDGPAELDRAQAAMVVVREFLAREVEKSEMLFLDTLGPSPFHADFLLRPEASGRAATAPLTFSHVEHHQGPDELIFRYDPDIYESAEAAFGDALADVTREAQFFYETVRAIQYEMGEWYRIETLVDSLIDLHRKRGIRGALRRTIGSSRTINEALIALSKFESRQLFDRAGRGPGYRFLFVEAKKPHLRHFVDEEVGDQATYPTRQSAELIRSFERRRSQSIDATALMASRRLAV